MTCRWCSQPADDTYHKACWRLRQEAASRDDQLLMRECHDAIQAIKRGESVQVSGACQERWGENLKWWRENWNKGSKQRRTESV